MINTGVAGSLNADLDIGDILISKDAIHHDVDATVFGYPLGELPQMGIREFIADEKLVNLAVESCKKVNPDLTVRTGRVVSGDQFISSDDVKKRLIEVFTDPGDVVIDPVAGSGTTLRAAYELGRSAYGFEVDKSFYEAAREKMLAPILTETTTI